MEMNIAPYLMFTSGTTPRVKVAECMSFAILRF